MKILSSMVALAAVLMLGAPASAQGLHRGPDGKFSMTLCIKNNSASGRWSASEVKARCSGIQQQHRERARLIREQRKSR